MDGFQKYVDEHEEVLSNMPVRAAAVLNEFCTLDLTEQESEKNEVIDMCQAVREMKEVSEQKGAIRVYYQELHYSAEQIAQKVGMDVKAVEKVIETLEE